MSEAERRRGQDRSARHQRGVPHAGHHLAEAARAAGADVLLSACSSRGPAVDTAEEHVRTPVVEIDDAMTTRVAVAQASVARLAPSVEEAIGVPVVAGPRAGVLHPVSVAHPAVTVE